MDFNAFAMDVSAFFLCIRKKVVSLWYNFIEMNTLQEYISKIEELCKIYNVKQLYAFGSVLTDRFNSDSDIDLIVNFNKIPVENYADNYFDFKFLLQDMFKRPVDLLEEQAIKNPYFIQNINKNKQLIYG